MLDMLTVKREIIDYLQQTNHLKMFSFKKPQLWGNSKVKSMLTCGMLVGFTLFWCWVLTFPMTLIRLDSLPDRTVVVLPSLSFEILMWIVGITLFLLARLRVTKGGNLKLSRVAERMAFLVPVVLASRLLFFHHHILAANIIYYLFPAVMAWALIGILSKVVYSPTSLRRIILEWGSILLITSVAYWCLGCYFTKSVGEHSGDEGHYLIQARSLYEDGDLDIRNNLNNPKNIKPSTVHISPASRADNWYSWHSFGLSLLLAPTEGGDMVLRHLMPEYVIRALKGRGDIVLRHLVLGLIAGMGIAGVYLLCLQIGSPRNSTYLVLLLLGGSAFYVIYACRALPEVLGATLATYGMVATLAQKRNPWLSLFITVLVVGFLPWVHVRFIPLALTVLGCYGLCGLIEKKWQLSNLIRLGILTILCLIALAAYQLFQLTLFEGGFSYPVSNLLFTNLLGLWHTLASERGILFAFPVFACALPACIYLLFDRSRCLYATFVLLYFLSVFLTSCSTPWFTGGSSLAGRFLVVVIPIVVASLAPLLPRSNAGFRWLVYYLGFFSVCILVAELSVLEGFNKSFTDPYAVRVVHPFFQGLGRLFDLYNPYNGVELMPALLLYGVGTLLLLARAMPYRMQAGLLLGSTITLLTTSGIAKNIEYRHHTPRQVALFLEQTDLERALLVVAKEGSEERDLFEFSNRFPSLDNHVVRVTTDDLGKVNKNGSVSVPYLPLNDWAGREFRWATMVAPFSAGKGERAFALKGRVSDKADVQLVVREGAHTLVSHRYATKERVSDRMTFRSEKRGAIYILVRIAGKNGEFMCDLLDYSAYSAELLKAANLALTDGNHLQPYGRKEN